MSSMDFIAARATELPAYLQGIDPETYCNKTSCPLELANFEYVPSLGGNIAYAAIFAVILIAQLYLGIRHKTWGFLIGNTLGLITEIIGYVGRVQLFYNPFLFDPFVMQLVCLTIAPAFLCAAIYLCLGRIVVVYGRSISRVKPRTYTYIFVTCDFISLLLQAVGGAITAIADDEDQQQLGIDIMMAGLIFQVVAIAVFAIVCIEYAFRVRRHSTQKTALFRELRSTPMFKYFLFALAGAVLLIFVRCVFRVAELSQGFDGPIANSEPLFMVFEGPMLFAAVILLTVFHPGVCFHGRWADAHPNATKQAAFYPGAKNTSTAEYSTEYSSMLEVQNTAPTEPPRAASPSPPHAYGSDTPYVPETRYGN